jgi:very-short-patch-repair endonuclease
MTKHSTQIIRAKQLRKNMSDAESKFWYRINRNQLGVKFRRQQPIGPILLILSVIL